MMMMKMIPRVVMMIRRKGCLLAFGFAKGEAAAGSNSNIGNFHTPSTLELLGNSYISLIFGVLNKHIILYFLMSTSSQNLRF